MKYLILILALGALSACGDQRLGKATNEEILQAYNQCCADHGVSPNTNGLVVKDHPTVQDQCWDKVNQ
jgi:hypothetical protein